uniref:Uncharacterized protein n=1 Tax=Molossus molossus TaxID=27622 RepID=A0A7J8JVT3_MOLMO|nr:hypothetical protein HJG59_007989 [Molossus molossus]
MAGVNFYSSIICFVYLLCLLQCFCSLLLCQVTLLSQISLQSNLSCCGFLEKLILERGRKRERERERERERDLCERETGQQPMSYLHLPCSGMEPVCALTRYRTCNLGMCPDQESNLPHFGIRDEAPTSQATLARALWQFLIF